MKEGIYEKLSAEQYHADTAIGSSGLKSFKECPAIYWHDYLNPDRVTKDESKYSSIGSHAHVALLEPEIFARDYVVAPADATINRGKKNEIVKAMNKAHGEWKEFEAEAIANNKKPLLMTEYLQANAMAEAIKNHSLANKMLTGGKAEVSFLAKDETTDLMMKARPDYLVKVQGIGVVLVDYKTTSLPLGVSKQSNHAFSLGRHLQAAHHKAVTELATGGVINEVCYITQMQSAPHLIRIFRMSEDAIIIGKNERRQYLDSIAECHTKNIWPDYPHEIEDLILPKWMDYDFN